jgi:membrane associated rhomboid family serine protease
MFPISDSLSARRFPFVSLFLIILTLYVFFQQVIASDGLGFLEINALIPANVNLSNWMTFVPFVTAIFLHGGLLHILSNMWFLWIFGDDVEGHLPPFIFLLLYVLAGVAGNLLQYFFSPGSSIPMIGASGAVAGVLGCYSILFPYAKVKSIVFLFFFVTIVEISAPLMLGYWFVLQVVSGTVSLPFLGDQGGVAFWAHAAGFVVGLVFGVIFKMFTQRGEGLEGAVVGFFCFFRSGGRFRRALWLGNKFSSIIDNCMFVLDFFEDILALMSCKFIKKIEEARAEYKRDDTFSHEEVFGGL